MHTVLFYNEMPHIYATHKHNTFMHVNRSEDVIDPASEVTPQPAPRQKSPANQMSDTPDQDEDRSVNDCVYMCVHSVINANVNDRSI